MRDKLLTLYVRNGCSLCDEAEVLLEYVLEEFPDWSFAQVDIDTDEVLALRYLYEVPVLSYKEETWNCGKFETDEIRKRLLEKK